MIWKKITKISLNQGSSGGQVVSMLAYYSVNPNSNPADVYSLVETWLTEFRIDRIRVVLQKGYVLYV